MRTGGAPVGLAECRQLSGASTVVLARACLSLHAQAMSESISRPLRVELCCNPPQRQWLHYAVPEKAGT